MPINSGYRKTSLPEHTDSRAKWVREVAISRGYFVPQVWRVTRYTRDISLLTYAFGATDVAIWFA